MSFFKRLYLKDKFIKFNQIDKELFPMVNFSNFCVFRKENQAKMLGSIL